MLNKVQLIGNLGRDPELRYTQGGSPVCNLSVATTRRVKNKATEQWEDETEWHRVTVFSRSAENCEKFLRKGSKVYIEGRLRTRSYDDKDGNKRYSTEIVADDVKFLDPRSEGGGGGRGRGRGGDEPAPYDPYAPGDYSPGPEDDDIPF